MFWLVSNGCFLSVIMIIIGSLPCCYDLLFHVRFTEAINSFFLHSACFQSALVNRHQTLGGPLQKLCSLVGLFSLWEHLMPDSAQPPDVVVSQKEHSLFFLPSYSHSPSISIFTELTAF